MNLLSKSKLFICLMFSFFEMYSEGTELTPDFCLADYSDGSLRKPCGYCRLCQKKWDNKTQTLIGHCVNIEKPYRPFEYLFDNYYTCYFRENCYDDSCTTTCVDLPEMLKCRCGHDRYGLTCQYTVPQGLNFSDFADVQTEVHTPFVYAMEFATFMVFFYQTGTNLNVVVDTDREILKFNKSSCQENTISPLEFCTPLYKDFVEGYETVCEGGPTYKYNTETSRCAITLNLAFSRIPFDEGDDDNSYMEDTGSTDKPKVMVAKAEYVTVTVYNEISQDVQKNIVYTRTTATMIIYKGKDPRGNCYPSVFVQRHSTSMKLMARLPRHRGISIPVTILENPGHKCKTDNPLSVSWFVWVITYNHDEKHDPPNQTMYQVTRLMMDQYSLDVGIYKVKLKTSVVIDDYFNEATSYCYFQVVYVPLHLEIMGGSLRYVYYKDSLELVTTRVIDPNYDLHNQPRMRFRWSCDNRDMICAPTTTDDTVLKVAGPFTPGKVYNFTVEIMREDTIKYELLGETQKSNKQVVIVYSEPIPNLLIDCLKNCGGKNFKSDTGEIFYFRVSLSPSQYIITEHYYRWSYKSTDGSSFLNTDTIRQGEPTPSSILIVKENSLLGNKKYLFQVTYGNKSLGKAEIEIHTFHFSETLNCAISSKTGVSGKPEFSVSCLPITDMHSPVSVIFTYYDCYVTGYPNGRLLGSSYTGRLDGIFLTRGRVDIYVATLHGHFINTSLSVSLSPPEINRTFVQDCLRTLRRIEGSAGYEQTMSFISSISEFLNNDTSLKSLVVKPFLKVISEQTVNNLIDVELLLDATQSIVCDGLNCPRKNLTDSASDCLNRVILNICQRLTDEMLKSPTFNPELNTGKVNKLWRSLLNTAGILFNTREENLLNKALPELDRKLYDVVKWSTHNLMKSLGRFEQAFALRTLPYIKRSLIKTEYVSWWMKEADPSHFTEGTKGDDDISYIEISEELAEWLRNTSEYIVVQILAFKNDPFWWIQSDDRVSTNVISVNIGYKSTDGIYNSISSFQRPVDVYLKRDSEYYQKPVTIDGKVTQPNPKDDLSINDLAVAVHKIFPQKGSKVLIHFLNLSESDMFKVLINENLRPDYESMESHAKNITKSSPRYESETNVDSYENTIVYVGILPGAHVPVGAVVQYRFTLDSARCQLWYDLLWTSTGCIIGANTTQDYLHCQCNHLSSVSGFMEVPVNSINPFTDIELLLTIPENPYIFVFILVILILYVILLIWAMKKDKDDRTKATMVQVEDNISTDTFGYLVTVLTGSRLFGGTSSNIGFVMEGSKATSRAHLLRSSTRHTLSRNNDDWFLIFTPKHLGKIKFIHLWSDHSGTRPNWFCDQIDILDLTTNADYAFMIKRWFGATHREFSVEIIASPKTLEERKHFAEYFYKNTIFGFRETHMWLSVLARHPRSPVSRAQRSTMAMCAVMVTLLSSIAFYKAVIPGYEDIYRYNFQTRDFMISIYSLCISVTVAYLVYLAFKKSYVYHAYRQASSEPSLSKSEVIVSSALRAKRGCNFKYIFVKTMCTLRKKHFLPVLTNADAINIFVGVNRKRAMFAWLLALFIIFGSAIYISLCGLKLGKLKSILWLSTIAISLGGDIVIVSPVKVVTIAVIFGLFRIPFCDFYVFDPDVYRTMKTALVRQSERRNTDLRHARSLPVYKPLVLNQVEMVYRQHRKIHNWWVFIEITDMCVSFLLLFWIISEIMPKEIVNTSFNFGKLFCGKDHCNENNKLVVKNLSQYDEYVYNRVIHSVYVTRWYNERPLSLPGESFPETGWLLGGTHRLIGAPRLRQIRVVPRTCKLPSLMLNLSVQCLVRFSSATEDEDDYGFEWRPMMWMDTFFKGSPWKFFHPNRSSSVGMYGDSGTFYSTGGYVASFSRTLRGSENLLVTLTDTHWLDLRTRAVLFESTFYSVNVNYFTSVTLITEFLESMPTPTRLYVWSISNMDVRVMISVMFVVYTLFALTKLIMLLNTLGVNAFIRSFWYMSDAVFIVIGIVCFVRYVGFITMASIYFHAFQQRGKDVDFHLQGVIYSLKGVRNVVGLVLVMRAVRLFKLPQYVSSSASGKLKYTLYFSWTRLLWATVVFLVVVFGLGRLAGYLTNLWYRIGVSHFLAFKKNVPSTHESSLHPEKTMIIFLPHFISYLAMFTFAVILINSFHLANKQIKLCETKIQ